METERDGPRPEFSLENTVGVVYTSGFLHDSFRFVAAEFGFFGQAEEGRTKKPAAGPVTLTSGRRGVAGHWV